MRNFRRKNKRTRRERLLMVILPVALCIVVLLILTPRNDSAARTPGMRADSDSVVTPRVYEIERIEGPIRNYGEFDDSANVQTPVARALGIVPTTDDSIRYHLQEGSLVRVDNTPTYYLHDVSYPYLIPEAAHVLGHIGKMYKEYTPGDTTRLRVTSCLRTLSHVRKLRRRNVNAVDSSCHLHGTTFDISYSRMRPDEKQALARVLREMRAAGYIYVKYERKQPCFHITIRK